MAEHRQFRNDSTGITTQENQYRNNSTEIYIILIFTFPSKMTGGKSINHGSTHNRSR